jgi:hypothetical protein
VVVRVVVALLLAGVDAVGARRVEQVLDAVGTAEEAAAAHEHDRVMLRLVAVAPAPALMTAGDVGDLDLVAMEQYGRGHHGASLPDEHGCPRPREPAAVA